MRKIPTWQTTRRVLTASALATFATGGLLLGAGTASAATTLAGNCTGSVQGSMDDTVAISGTALSTVVQNAAKKNEIFLHLNGVDPAKLGSVIASKGTLTIGKIPESAGGTISGASIASVVTSALQNEGALGESLLGTKAKTLQYISQDVTSGCGLTTLASNYQSPSTAGTSPNAGRQPATAGGTAADGSPLGNLVPGSGTAPKRDYSGIPTASPGIAPAPGMRYPANGTLPGDAAAPSAGAQSGQGNGADVRNAGNAESLASDSSSNDVQLPMLLAVIVLAGVTAGLVRTWVLRRAS